MSDFINCLIRVSSEEGGAAGSDPTPVTDSMEFTAKEQFAFSMLDNTTEAVDFGLVGTARFIEIVTDQPVVIEQNASGFLETVDAYYVKRCNGITSLSITNSSGAAARVKGLIAS